MQAAVFLDIGQIELNEMPDPICPPGGVLLRVDACALCGTDVKIFRFGRDTVQPPAVLGHEIAATVVEVSPGAQQKSSLSPGERVVAMPNFFCGVCDPCLDGMPGLCTRRLSLGFELPGGLAEYVAVPAMGVDCGNILSYDPDVAPEHTCLAEPLACVIAGQEKVAVGPGDRVAIIGTGPIGCLHIALARLRGAAQILAIDVVASKLHMAEPFGADAYIDASHNDVLTQVRKLTHDHGADVVIVAAPAVQAHQEAVAMAALRGRICYFAGLSAHSPTIDFDARAVHYRELAVVGSFASNPRHNRLALELIVRRQIDAGRLVSHCLPLAETPKGLALVEGGQALKVVISPSAG
jgi:L-iditol 2-dehydrogenase